MNVIDDMLTQMVLNLDFLIKYFEYTT